MWDIKVSDLCMYVWTQHLDGMKGDGMVLELRIIAELTNETES